MPTKKRAYRVFVDIVVGYEVIVQAESKKQAKDIAADTSPDMFTSTCEVDTRIVGAEELERKTTSREAVITS